MSGSANSPVVLLLGLILGIALALVLADHVQADCIPKVRDVPEDAQVRRYEPVARGVGRDVGVPGDLLLTIAHVESNGDPNAVNPVSGARSLVQAMPFWWEPSEDWRDPYIALRKGAGILREAFLRLGDWQMAARAYGGWPGYETLIFRLDCGE